MEYVEVTFVQFYNIKYCKTVFNEQADTLNKFVNKVIIMAFKVLLMDCVARKRLLL